MVLFGIFLTGNCLFLTRTLLTTYLPTNKISATYVYLCMRVLVYVSKSKKEKENVHMRWYSRSHHVVIMLCKKLNSRTATLACCCALFIEGLYSCFALMIKSIRGASGQGVNTTGNGIGEPSSNSAVCVFSL